LDGVDGKAQHIEWSLVEGCGTLRQLSSTKLSDVVVDWLNSNGQSVSELIVTNRFSYNTHGMKEYCKLRLPKLSMLVTQQGHIATATR